MKILESYYKNLMKTSHQDTNYSKPKNLSPTVVNDLDVKVFTGTPVFRPKHQHNKIFYIIHHLLLV